VRERADDDPVNVGLRDQRVTNGGDRAGVTNLPRYVEPCGAEPLEGIRQADLGRGMGAPLRPRSARMRHRYDDVEPAPVTSPSTQLGEKLLTVECLMTDDEIAGHGDLPCWSQYDHEPGTTSAQSDLDPARPRSDGDHSFPRYAAFGRGGRARRPLYHSAVADPFDELMSRVDTAMIVLTTASGDSRAGCLVGFHCQCSIDPPRYAVWLSKANHTYRLALLAERFGLHFLTEADHDIAEHFGSLTGDDTDKFAGVEWHEGDGAVPLLERCPHRVVARRHAMWDDGSDHVCFVLEPLDVNDPNPFAPMPFSRVADVEAGHGSEERQRES